MDYCLHAWATYKTINTLVHWFLHASIYMYAFFKSAYILMSAVHSHTTAIPWHYAALSYSCSTCKCRSVALVAAHFCVLKRKGGCVAQGNSLVMSSMQIEEAPPALRSSVQHRENAHKRGELASCRRPPLLHHQVIYGSGHARRLHPLIGPPVSLRK